MRPAVTFATRAIITGLLVVVLIYIAVLLVLKGMTSVVGGGLGAGRSRV